VSSRVIIPRRSSLKGWEKVWRYFATLKFAGGEEGGGIRNKHQFRGGAPRSKENQGMSEHSSTPRCSRLASRTKGRRKPQKSVKLKGVSRHYLKKGERKSEVSCLRRQ